LQQARAEDLPKKARQAGLNYIEFPIPEDGALPGIDTMDLFVTDLADRVERGERIVVFSNHGWGRAGVIGMLTMWEGLC